MSVEKISSVKRVQSRMYLLRPKTAAIAMYSPTQIPVHALSVRKGTLLGLGLGLALGLGSGVGVGVVS